ncbi:MAG: VTT domain-containing protein [Chloroflexi bacterium]|nr:VTT domain-containing protein [Chloroflexota bacterium]
MNPGTPSPPAAQVAGERRRRTWRILALALVLALSVAIILFQDWWVRFRTYGYLGLFLITMLSNATVIFPAPGLVLPFSMGAVLHPFWVALVAALGATVGELSGYLAGFSGQAFVEDYRAYHRVRALMQRYGDGVLFVLAALPTPLFDLAGIVAGATRIPLRRFVLWTFAGKLVKMLAVTYAGDWFLAWLRM